MRDPELDVIFDWWFGVMVRKRVVDIRRRDRFVGNDYYQTMARRARLRWIGPTWFSANQIIRRDGVGLGLGSGIVGHPANQTRQGPAEKRA